MLSPRLQTVIGVKKKTKEAHEAAITTESPMFSPHEMIYQTAVGIGEVGIFFNAYIKKKTNISYNYK